jgi:hypothetical protein
LQLADDLLRIWAEAHRPVFTTPRKDLADASFELHVCALPLSADVFVGTDFVVEVMNVQLRHREPEVLTEPAYLSEQLLLEGR